VRKSLWEPLVKRILILIVAAVVATSTYNYCGTAGHYGLVVIVGILVAFFLVGKYL
jgi:hypothetical protein